MTAPEHAADLAAALGVVPVELDAGHSLMTEAPDALLQALRRAILG